MNQARKALDEFGATRAEWWRDPPRGKCGREGCFEHDAILYTARDGELVCAEHLRRQADRNRPYPCDNCGHEPAFRDPLERKDEMLCAKCHERNGYVPGKRAMISKIERRQGVTHSLGRKDVCIAAGKGTECRGQVKQRGRVGVVCDLHHDPVKYNKNKGV